MFNSLIISLSPFTSRRGSPATPNTSAPPSPLASQSPSPAPSPAIPIPAASPHTPLDASRFSPIFAMTFEEQADPFDENDSKNGSLSSESRSLGTSKSAETPREGMPIARKESDQSLPTANNAPQELFDDRLRLQRTFYRCPQPGKCLDLTQLALMQAQHLSPKPTAPLPVNQPLPSPQSVNTPEALALSLSSEGEELSDPSSFSSNSSYSTSPDQPLQAKEESPEWAKDTSPTEELTEIDLNNSFSSQPATSSSLHKETSTLPPKGGLKRKHRNVEFDWEQYRKENPSEQASRFTLFELAQQRQGPVTPEGGLFSMDDV